MAYLYEPTVELGYLLNLLVAAALGFFIGLERKLRAKDAGIGTHTVLAVGAALTMLVSKYAFESGLSYDASRIAASIVSGIGFLGTGLIIFRKQSIHGLTTAAGLWATAGVGMAAGGGMYILALGATVIIIGLQCLARIPKLKPHHFYVLRIRFIDADDETLNEAKGVFGVKRYTSITMSKEDGRVICHAELHTPKEFSSQALHEILQKYDCITSLQRGDE